MSRALDVGEQWLELLDAFVIAQRARGMTAGTIANRVKHVRRFAATMQMPADHVTYEDYRGWLDNLDCARHRQGVLRTSLRAFFRWASASGRVHHDPTDEPEYVTRIKPVPSAWEADLKAFSAYQRSVGRPGGTIRAYASRLNQFAREHHRHTPDTITHEIILDWLAVKRWAVETRRGARSTLRAFFRWAHETGRIRHDPAAKLPPIPPAVHLPRPVLEDEYARALERADEREVVALRLAAELGLRCAEVAAVHSRDLFGTPEGPVLRVHGKGSRDRDLPLTETLARMLRVLPPGYAFPGRGRGHITPAHLGKLISQLLPEGVTMHALRHRFASRAYNHSGDVLTVQQLLGHASPNTTMVYVRLDQSARRRLIEQTAI